MRTPRIEAEYECPHCGYGYTLAGSDSIFTDHVTDECAQQCEDCGGWYQLKCESVDVYMSATAAPASVIPKRPPSLAE
jgi:predicted anti-sigma-YlaC factor YlaD